jgi:pSer/pThr/pTyr-binding forkhead associated (FHA) protein
MTKLRVTVNGKVDREVEVDRELVVGRKAPADIVIADSQVSSRHARIRPDGEGITVADLNSTNGTRIDAGERLAPDTFVALRRGQKLLIGPAILEIVDTQRADSDAGFARTEKTVAVGGGQLQSVLVNIAKFKAARARLVVAAEHAKKALPIEEMEVVIGREAPPAQIEIAHPSISSKHASLRFEGGQFSITDLASANGTFVDGVRISAATPLGLQTAVTIGTVDCLFVQRAPEAGGAAGAADPFAEVLCDHAVRLGKATQQEARAVLAEHRADGATLGELFVLRGVFTPREWAELYRQREMLKSLGSAAPASRGSASRTIGIVVIVVGLLALAAFAAKATGLLDGLFGKQ